MAPQIYTSSPCLNIFLVTSLLADIAAAVCTNWTQVGVDINGDILRHYIPVDVLLCPSDAKEICYFNQKSYDITDKRELLSSDLLSSLAFTDEDTEVIFKLAQDGFNEKVPESPREFVDRNGTVTTTTLDKDAIALRAEPGMNTTLMWFSFRLYSTGILSGCTNETLNNLTITATSSYLTEDEEMAGVWGSISKNVTNPNGTHDDDSKSRVGDDDEKSGVQDGGAKSGAESFRISPSSIIGALMMSLTVVGFVIS